VSGGEQSGYGVLTVRGSYWICSVLAALASHINVSMDCFRGVQVERTNSRRCLDWYATACRSCVDALVSEPECSFLEQANGRCWMWKQRVDYEVYAFLRCARPIAVPVTAAMFEADEIWRRVAIASIM